MTSPSDLPAPIVRLTDGTVKQRNPLTGTEVWTVPGRGHRPLGGPPTAPTPLDPAQHDRYCTFCPGRYLQTPPEKSRAVRSADGEWSVLPGVTAEELSRTTAEFRRIPNLFEILNFDYWYLNHGYVPPAHLLRRLRDYLTTSAGRDHVQQILRHRALARGTSEAEWEALDDTAKLMPAIGLFASGHDVIVARRHFVDGATHDNQLAGAGTLTPDEHAQYVATTVEAMRALYGDNPHTRYVAAFQNWLKPAGASIDHLHKQVVAVDEFGRQLRNELDRARREPNVYNDAALGLAVDEHLLVAENEHAVAFAGVGHRYPTLEVFSKSGRCLPWALTAAELRGFSDLLHACHAATGTSVPSNEEWHHRPPSVREPMPLRVMLKWRVSTLAGFEGGTKINVNTISPDDLRSRVVARLLALRARGDVAEIAVGDECDARRDALRYLDDRS